MTEAKNTVIVVSTVPVFPCIQGNRRVIGQLLEWLRREGCFTIFVHQVDTVSERVIVAHQEICDHYIVVGDFSADLSILVAVSSGLRRFACKVYNRFILPLLRKYSCNLRDLRPHQSDNLSDKARSCWPKTKLLVRHLAKIHQCRAVIAEYHFMTGVFDVVPTGVLKLVQTHDACSLVSEKIGAVGENTQGREITYEQERQNLLLADVIIAIQKEEQRYFAKMLPERTIIKVGYAAEGGTINNININQRKYHVFFAGSANPLNRRGIEQFLTHAWPIVLKHHPDAICSIAGKVCEMLPLVCSEGVQLKGELDSLEDELDRAGIVINPVDLGTGLKIKTIEALGRGKALVSTPEGVAGLFPLPQELPFRIASDWPSFAHEIVQLIDNPNAIVDLEASALCYAKEFLSIDAVYRELGFILDCQRLS